MGRGFHQHQSTRETITRDAKMPWEPRTKLLSGLLCIFVVISLKTPALLALALAFAITFALFGGLAPAQLLKRLVVLLPFLALMSLPLLFGAGYPPPADRIEMIMLLLLKVLTTMTYTLFIFTNQPIENMLEAMEHLKVPAVITTVIYLAYRYGFLFISEMQTTLRALKARLFKAGVGRKALPVYGELAGGLFIRSLNRSETVYRAMASRGFRGKMPVGPPRMITRSDLLKAAFPLLLIVTLFIAEQVVL